MHNSTVDTEALFSFQNQAAVIQRDAICWLHTVAPQMFDVQPQDFFAWWVSAIALLCVTI